jgi:branched-subunit amino acid ABC-type transport system permease component
MVAGGIGEVAGAVATGYAAGYSPTGGKDGKGGWSVDEFKK